MQTINSLAAKIIKLEQRVAKLEAKLTPPTKDLLILQAKKLIKTHSLVSVSFLQRSLKIGYARASSIMDELVQQGLVAGPNSQNLFDVM